MLHIQLKKKKGKNLVDPFPLAEYILVWFLTIYFDILFSRSYMQSSRLYQALQQASKISKEEINA